jgi:hypothetical protein
VTVYGMAAVIKRDPWAQFSHAYELVAHRFNDEQRATIERAIHDVGLADASPGARAAMQASSPDE